MLMAKSGLAHIRLVNVGIAGKHVMNPIVGLTTTLESMSAMLLKVALAVEENCPGSVVGEE